MTNYFKMPPIDREVNETKETVFKNIINTEFEIIEQ